MIHTEIICLVMEQQLNVTKTTREGIAVSFPCSAINEGREINAKKMVCSFYSSSMNAGTESQMDRLHDL